VYVHVYVLVRNMGSTYTFSTGVHAYKPRYAVTRINGTYVHVYQQHDLKSDENTSTPVQQETHERVVSGRGKHYCDRSSSTARSVERIATTTLASMWAWARPSTCITSLSVMVVLIWRLFAWLGGGQSVEPIVPVVPVYKL
jgi:hypothetical protein